MVSFSKAVPVVAATDNANTILNTTTTTDNEAEVTYKYQENIRVEFPARDCANGAYLSMTKEFLKRLFRIQSQSLAIISCDGTRQFTQPGQCPTTEETYRQFFPRAKAKYQRAKERFVILIKCKSNHTLDDLKRIHPEFLEWLQVKDYFTFTHHYETIALTSVGWLYGAHPSFQHRAEVAVMLKQRIKQYQLDNETTDNFIPQFEIIGKTYKDHVKDDEGTRTLAAPVMEIRCELVHRLLLERLLLNSQSPEDLPLLMPYSIRHTHPQKFQQKMIEHCHRNNNLKVITLKGVDEDALNSELVDTTDTLATVMLDLRNEDDPDARRYYWVHSIEQTKESTTEGRWTIVIQAQYTVQFHAWFADHFHQVYAKTDAYPTVRNKFPRPSLESNFPLQQEAASWLLNTDTSVIPTTVVLKKARVAKEPAKPKQQTKSYAQATGHGQKRKTTPLETDSSTETDSTPSEITDRWKLYYAELESKNDEQISNLEKRLKDTTARMDKLQVTTEQMQVHNAREFTELKNANMVIGKSVQFLTDSVNLILSRLDSLNGQDHAMSVPNVSGNKHPHDDDETPFIEVTGRRAPKPTLKTSLLQDPGPHPGRLP